MPGDRYDKAGSDGETERGYRWKLRELQIELVKFQRHLIKHGERMLVLIEDRDAAGKDGVINHIVEHLSPRDTRVVALPAPNAQQQTEWYFQRHVAHLPAAGEFVLFNRSWYNRAGVERVMGFCSEQETERFLDDAPIFERMLVSSGLRLFKYYLDIDRHEQMVRLKERRHDPLTQWKTSPVDKLAVKHWDDFTIARDIMLRRTHSQHAPWHIVRSDDKRRGRLNCISHILRSIPYKEVPHAKVNLPKRSDKGKYDDRATLNGRNFVREAY